MIEALLTSLWQGAVVVGIAAGVCAFIPKGHAATRYSVWFVALVALAVLPICGQISFGHTASAIPTSLVRPTAAATQVAKQAASDLGGLFTLIWISGVVACLTRLALSYFHVALIHELVPDKIHPRIEEQQRLKKTLDEVSENVIAPNVRTLMCDDTCQI